MTEDLRKLADRVEGLQGADRETACAIAKAIGWRPDDGAPGSTTSSPWAWCPDFTASLDAAMTLVPKEWLLDLKQWPSPTHAERAEFGNQWGGWTTDHWRVFLTENEGGFGQVSAIATSPVPAITAAALRARSQQGDKP